MNIHTYILLISTIYILYIYIYRPYPQDHKYLMAIALCHYEYYGAHNA